MGTTNTNAMIVLAVFSLAGYVASTPWIEESNFWFLQKLEQSETDVDWPAVMANMSFTLDAEQQKTVMNVAALNGVNPLLLITYLELEGSWPTGEEDVVTFGNRLLDTEQHYEKMEFFPEFNAPTSAIWWILNQNDTELKVFVDKFHSMRVDNRIATRKISKRQQQEDSDTDWYGIVHQKIIDLKLGWPWLEGACWDIGAPHSHAQPCEFCDIKSALDMGPDLKFEWCEDKRIDCNEDGKVDGNDNPCDMTSCPANFPWVTATHDGVVSQYPARTSSCSLKILSTDTGIATWYGHLDGIVVLPGQSVKKGQKIARIAQTKVQAECDNSNNTRNGPHLHYSIWYDEKTMEFDKPLDLKFVNVEEISFKPGRIDYDYNCTDCDSDCSSAVQSEVDGSYCPWTPQRGSNYGHFGLGFSQPGSIFGPPLPVARIDPGVPASVPKPEIENKIESVEVEKCFNVYDFCCGGMNCVKARNMRRARNKVMKKLTRGCPQGWMNRCPVKEVVSNPWGNPFGGFGFGGFGFGK